MQIVESNQLILTHKILQNTASIHTVALPVENNLWIKNRCIIQPAYKSIQFFIILSETFSDPAGSFSTRFVALGRLLDLWRVASSRSAMQIY